MLTLRQIQSEVDRLAQQAGLEKTELPTYGKETSRDFGYPHIEVDGTHYHYVVVERGAVQSRKSTTQIDELLYWIFEGVTSSMGFAYELAHRIEDRDGRRIAFAKQIELMTAISPELGARVSRKIDEILRIAPYDDERIRAVNRMRRGITT